MQIHRLIKKFCKFISLFSWIFSKRNVWSTYNVLIKPILQIDSVLIICKNYNVTFDWKYMMTVIIIKRADFQKFPPIRRINIMPWCYYLWMNRDVISNHDFLVPYNKKECHENFYQKWSNQFDTLEKRIQSKTSWFDAIWFQWKIN